jgi:hypothetical protein
MNNNAQKIFELALEDDKNIPLFIEFHRKLRPGGGNEQLEQIAELLSDADTDNGLRLLAACCVYAIDNPDIEENIGEWLPEYVGDDAKKQEKLFKYMLTEVANWDTRTMGTLNEFLVDYFTETLDAMDVEYDEEALEEVLENIDINKLPTLKKIK